MGAASAAQMVEMLQTELEKVMQENLRLLPLEAQLVDEQSRAATAETTIGDLKQDIEKLMQQNVDLKALEKKLEDEKRRASLAKTILQAKVAQMNESNSPQTLSPVKDQEAEQCERKELT